MVLYYYKNCSRHPCAGTHALYTGAGKGIRKMNNKSLELIGYYEITEKLAKQALTARAKERARALHPFLSESELRKNLRETTQAREMIGLLGLPPLPAMEHIEAFIEKAVIGELLMPEHLEEMGLFLNAVRRLKLYLKKGEEQHIQIAFYNDNLVLPEELKDNIERCIRAGRVDDHASGYLNDIRRQIKTSEEKINEKAARALKAAGASVSESFIVQRNGRLCIPVKKECRLRVPGSVVDKSSTGATVFIEPETVASLREELEILKIQEDSEERRILYELLEQIALNEEALREDVRVIALLDFVFAKAKLSFDMKAAEPHINLSRYISVTGARHPMLDKETCVPLDFEAGRGVSGIIITGPNTGGKTVALKTVALISAMACAGLHVPCASADIAMNNQILCDIGDGQNMTDNLSTFSAHIKNVLDILKRVTKDSLVIMDELGSGTDPAEGMGIAVAILEELRKSGALFFVTTHYPEVKEYAGRHPDIANARMEFDKETLKPLYRLTIGESGDSCALYIAKRLGVPDNMLAAAAREAYGPRAEHIISELGTHSSLEPFRKISAPRLKPVPDIKLPSSQGQEFTRGDSVTILPDKKIGIVVRPADSRGNVLVQVQKEKFCVNRKRLELKVAASQLYPEDYDFSIIFDSAEHRKIRHQMERKYEAGLEIESFDRHLP